MRGVANLGDYFQHVANSKVSEASNAKHANTACSLGFLCALSACADCPEEAFKIACRHADAVIAYSDFLIIDGNLDPVAFITGRGVLAKRLNSNCIDRVLNILPDKG